MNLDRIKNLIERLNSKNLFLVGTLNVSALITQLDFDNLTYPEDYQPNIAFHLTVCLREDIPLIDIRSDTQIALENYFESLVVAAEQEDFYFYPIDIKEGYIHARSTTKAN